MHAWASGRWIDSTAAFPALGPGAGVEAVYETHLAMETHPLAATLGGLAGFKIGAVGVENEVAFYAPLFKKFLVDAPARGLSAAAIQMHQVEPEFGFILSRDVPPRADCAPHSVADLWACVQEVVLCIECCGQRATPNVVESLSKERLRRFQDALSAGGVVLGPRFSPDRSDPSRLSACSTSLLVNGVRVATGSGQACAHGGPAAALTWLANHLNSRGLALRSGQLVATGQTCVYRSFAVGDTITAEFGALGKLTMQVQP